MIGNLNSLENLTITDTMLTSLPESIVNLSQLRSLMIRGNKMTFLPEDLEKNSKVKLVLSGTPLKSLSNIPSKSYQNIHITGEQLTVKGKNLYLEGNYEELAKYYNKSCRKLAIQYISNPKSLTKDETERLFHEIGKNEEKYIENQLPLDDPLLKKIMERNSLKLSNGSKLYM